jgi:glycosyltransferase involved in cell wall biosynthesis
MLLKAEPSIQEAARSGLGGVTVAYGGVHQAYQLALAAQEQGTLDRFLCSFFNAAGKWGGRLARITGAGKLASRTCDGIMLERVTEYPWPLLKQHLLACLGHGTSDAWLETNERFDQWASKRVLREKSRIVIGTETCSRYLFDAAGQMGALRILDAPQWHQETLRSVLARGADMLGLRVEIPEDSARMKERKDAEYRNADWLLVYSESHRRSFEQAGYGAKNFLTCPLWADSRLWFPDPDAGRRPGAKLRVLFVGGINLRKGVPFLLEAIRKLQGEVELTLVGRIGSELKSFVGSRWQGFRLVPPKAKAELRKVYVSHDILVLPSLADSFGFVAMEAMACGLPVIVSENCGVPVPDPSWRVPVMNADAIAARLKFYTSDRLALSHDGHRAIQFAHQFTPARYRREIGAVLFELLGK